MGRPRATHKSKKEKGSLNVTRDGKEPTPALPVVTTKPSDILGEVGKKFFKDTHSQLMKAGTLAETDITSLVVCSLCWESLIESAEREKNETNSKDAWKWRAESRNLRLELLKWLREFGCTSVTRDVVNQIPNDTIDEENLFND